MGGGETKIKETPKRLRGLGGSDGGSGGGDDLTTPICERPQTVVLRLDGSIREGVAVRIVLGDPPAVVAGGKTIGRVTDRHQAATLAGCLYAGYEIGGEIVSVEADGHAGTASVVGVRSR